MSLVTGLGMAFHHKGHSTDSLDFDSSKDRRKTYCFARTGQEIETRSCLRRLIRLRKDHLSNSYSPLLLVVLLFQAPRPLQLAARSIRQNRRFLSRLPRLPPQAQLASHQPESRPHPIRSASVLRQALV